MIQVYDSLRATVPSITDVPLAQIYNWIEEGTLPKPLANPHEETDFKLNPSFICERIRNLNRCDSYTLMRNYGFEDAGKAVKTRDRFVRSQKRTLPAFVSAVKSTNRTIDTITEYTGLMTLDIDFERRVDDYIEHPVLNANSDLERMRANATFIHQRNTQARFINNKQLFSEEDIEELMDAIFVQELHVLASFRSPSNGIKLIIAVPICSTVDEYRRLFNEVVVYYRNSYQIQIDESGSDPVRLCFFSFDDTIRYRHDGATFDPDINHYEGESEEDSGQYSKLSVSSTSDDAVMLNAILSDAREVYNGIDVFVQEILDLPRRDNEGKIDSKHSTLLTIQIRALEYGLRIGMNKHTIHDSLFQAWKMIYPDNYSKHDDFQRAWAGAEKKVDEPKLQQSKGIVNISEYFYSTQRYDVATKESETARIIDLQLQNESIPFLQRGSISSLIALPASGKSSICTSLLAKVLNEDAESIYLNSTGNVNRIMYIDSENHDVQCSIMVKSLAKMANKSEHEILKSPNVKILPYLSIEYSVGYQVDLIQSLDLFLQSEKFDLVIIDDVSILVSDVNNQEQCKSAIKKLQVLAGKHKLGILVTLHSNPGTNLGKGRGHMGSELYRYGESSLHCMRDKDVFKISLDGNSAKLRNANLESGKSEKLYYVYDSTKGYMRACTDDEISSFDSVGQVRPSITEANRKLVDRIEQLVSLALSLPKSRIARSDLQTILKNDPDFKCTVNRFNNQFDNWKSKYSNNYHIHTEGNRIYIANYPLPPLPPNDLPQ